jgi:hypothetical protein
VFASGPPRDRLVKVLLEEAQRRPPNIPPLPKSFKHFRSELGVQVYGAMGITHVSVLPVSRTGSPKVTGSKGRPNQPLPIGLQISPQSVESLLSHASAFFRIELVRILALSTAGEGGGAGGVVAMLCVQVVGQLRFLGEGGAIEALGRCVQLLARHLAQLGQGDPFSVIGSLLLSSQDCRQFAIECHQALTLLDRLG